MTNLTCANCAYEFDELNEIDLCQTCWKAYEAGYEKDNLYHEMGLL